MEKYVNIVDFPQKSRKLFCVFRISCHDLEIERGRYNNPPKPPEDRICKLCKLEPETEEHFVLFCPTYRKLRIELFKNIVKQDPTIYNIPHSERFIYLMSNQNLIILKEVMSFLLGAYSDRTLLLRGQTPRH